MLVLTGIATRDGGEVSVAVHAQNADSLAGASSEFPLDTEVARTSIRVPSRVVRKAARRLKMVDGAEHERVTTEAAALRSELVELGVKYARLSAEYAALSTATPATPPPAETLSTRWTHVRAEISRSGVLSSTKQARDGAATYAAGPDSLIAHLIETMRGLPSDHRARVMDAALKDEMCHHVPSESVHSTTPEAPLGTPAPLGIGDWVKSSAGDAKIPPHDGRPLQIFHVDPNGNLVFEAGGHCWHPQYFVRCDPPADAPKSETRELQVGGWCHLHPTLPPSHVRIAVGDQPRRVVEILPAPPASPRVVRLSGDPSVIEVSWHIGYFVACDPPGTSWHLPGCPGNIGPINHASRVCCCETLAKKGGLYT